MMAGCSLVAGPGLLEEDTLQRDVGMLLPDTCQFQSATALQLAIYVFAPRLLNQLFFFLTASCFAFFFLIKKRNKLFLFFSTAFQKPPRFLITSFARSFYIRPSAFWVWCIPRLRFLFRASHWTSFTFSPTPHLPLL